MRMQVKSFTTQSHSQSCHAWPDSQEFGQIILDDEWYFRGFRDNCPVFERATFGWPIEDIPRLIVSIDLDRAIFK
jgi:hypothetical protein